MPDETKKALEMFLAAVEPDEEIEAATIPTAPVVAPPVDAVAVVVTPPTPTTDMIDLAAHLKRIGMAAKDLHYRAKGKPFYGEHLLADLIYDVEHETDDLIEVYFLGATGIEPPRMAEICSQATMIPVNYSTDKLYFETGLMDICMKTAHLVEKIKRDFPDLVAGVHAILDNISQRVYVGIGLLDKTIQGAERN